MLLAVGIVGLVLGCVPSLHPLYTEKDVTYDLTLLGVWGEKDETDTWTFKESEGKAYELIMTQDGTPGKFKAHLVRLGELQFLDLYPEAPDIGNEFYKMHLVPAHTFLRINIDKGKDAMRIAAMQPNWLEEAIDSKKVTIAHERPVRGDETTIVLTASTKELQEFVVKNAAEAFGEATELHRRK
jgi:hypothetical protein